MAANAFESGLEHQRAGRLAEAEAEYGRVGAAEPSYGKAIFLLGSIALVSGRAESAIELLQRAVAWDTGNAAFLAGLAEAQRRLGRWLDAAETFQRALRQEPTLLEVNRNAARLFEDAGELEVSIAFLERCRELGPPNDVLDAVLERQWIAYLEGAPPRSPPRQLEADELCRRGWRMLAEINAKQGRTDVAIGHQRRALGYAPNDVATLLELAELLASSGSWEEARLRQQQIMKIAPERAPSLLSTGSPVPP